MKITSSNNFLNFGYIPSDNVIHDIRGKLFGHINLFKRLQAKDIFKALDIQSEDCVLDFGCGMGFYTIEMAKLAKEAIGIDINPYITTIKIPAELEGRLRYVQVSGDDLPFPDNYFDRVLASEILPMMQDPNNFLREIKRVLKPGGRLVIVNGAGHPAIEDAYQKQSCLFRFLKRKYPERFPKNYAKYEEILQKSFGTSQSRFLKKEDITELVKHNGLRNPVFTSSPGYMAGAYFSWAQFILYLRKGRTLSQHGFLFNFYLFSFLRMFEKKTYSAGLICVCEN